MAKKRNIFNHSNFNLTSNIIQNYLLNTPYDSFETYKEATDFVSGLNEVKELAEQAHSKGLYGELPYIIANENTYLPLIVTKQQLEKLGIYINPKFKRQLKDYVVLHGSPLLALLFAPQDMEVCAARDNFRAFTNDDRLVVAVDIGGDIQQLLFYHPSIIGFVTVQVSSLEELLTYLKLSTTRIHLFSEPCEHSCSTIYNGVMKINAQAVGSAPLDVNKKQNQKIRYDKILAESIKAAKFNNDKSDVKDVIAIYKASTLHERFMKTARHFDEYHVDCKSISLGLYHCKKQYTSEVNYFKAQLKNLSINYSKDMEIEDCINYCNSMVICLLESLHSSNEELLKAAQEVADKLKKNNKGVKDTEDCSIGLKEYVINHLKVLEQKMIEANIIQEKRGHASVCPQVAKCIALEGLIKSIRRILSFDQDIKDYEYKIEHAIVPLDEDMCRANSIPQCGPIQAFEIVCTIGDISDFANADKLNSYMGYVPSIYGTGGKVRFGKMVERGRRECKQSLFMAIKSGLIRKGLNSHKDYKSIGQYMAKTISIYFALARDKTFYDVVKGLNSAKLVNYSKASYIAPVDLVKGIETAHQISQAAKHLVISTECYMRNKTEGESYVLEDYIEEVRKEAKEKGEPTVFRPMQSVRGNKIIMDPRVWSKIREEHIKSTAADKNVRVVTNNYLKRTQNQQQALARIDGSIINIMGLLQARAITQQLKYSRSNVKTKGLDTILFSTITNIPLDEKEQEKYNSILANDGNKILESVVTEMYRPYRSFRDLKQGLTKNVLGDAKYFDYRDALYEDALFRTKPKFMKKLRRIKWDSNYLEDHKARLRYEKEIRPELKLWIENNQIGID